MKECFLYPTTVVSSVWILNRACETHFITVVTKKTNLWTVTGHLIDVFVSYFTYLWQKKLGPFSKFFWFLGYFSDFLVQFLAVLVLSGRTFNWTRNLSNFPELDPLILSEMNHFKRKWPILLSSQNLLKSVFLKNILENRVKYRWWWMA